MSLIKGVNLGGWLVLERWITPNLFNKHRTDFIKEHDFKWIAEQGLNAVRVPVGYWIFGDVQPYVGSIEYLDFAMRAAQTYKLDVIIDLHGAPGSQNGWKHSGREGARTWHKDAANQELTLEIIEKLAKRYKGYRNLLGIELLNEPHWEVPFNVLVSFYQQAYERVRLHCDEKVAVIISDAFRPHDWQQTLRPPAYKNIWLDCHFYQVYSEKDKELNIDEHLNKTKGEWLQSIQILKQAHPVIVGEWSMALDQASL
jgi:glucan 1,3-beta-glucosidase